MPIQIWIESLSTAGLISVESCLSVNRTHLADTFHNPNLMVHFVAWLIFF